MVIELHAFYVAMGILGGLCLIMLCCGIYQSQERLNNKSKIEGCNICPICEGKGYRGGWRKIDDEEKYIRIKCDGCNGFGYRGFTDEILVPLKYEVDRSTLEMKYMLYNEQDNFI